MIFDRIGLHWVPLPYWFSKHERYLDEFFLISKNNLLLKCQSTFFLYLNMFLVDQSYCDVAGCKTQPLVMLGRR